MFLYVFCFPCHRLFPKTKTPPIAARCVGANLLQVIP
jgi:hypothetical protein